MKNDPNTIAINICHRGDDEESYHPLLKELLKNKDDEDVFSYNISTWDESSPVTKMFVFRLYKGPYLTSIYMRYGGFGHVEHTCDGYIIYSA